MTSKINFSLLNPPYPLCASLQYRRSFAQCCLVLAQPSWAAQNINVTAQFDWRVSCHLI